MLLFETIDRIHRIHQLIQREATGTPKEFADRLHIKRRQLYNILEEFKDYGACIRYSRAKSSFYYENSFEVMVRIEAQPLSEKEKFTTMAGCSQLRQMLPFDNSMYNANCKNYTH